MRDGGPFVGGRWSWGIEAAGAAAGNAAGYMELLGATAWSRTLVGPLHLDLRGSAGLAGGGGVPTGGGSITRWTVGAGLDLDDGLSTGLAGGRTWTQGGAVSGPYAQWWFSLPLEPSADAVGQRRGTLVSTEWAAGVQHKTRVARVDGSSRAMDTIGLKLNRAISETVYVSWPAHSAYAGGAGAYTMGLIGVGLASSTKPSAWRTGAELLVGAGGGGGVQSGGGALAHAVVWSGWRIGDDLEARLGAGAVRSRSGALSSPLLDLTLVRRFGQHAP